MSSIPTRFKIALGEHKLHTDFPAGTVELSIREPKNSMTRELFCSRLSKFLLENPLDLSSPIVVVTDKTRLCDYPTYLPLLTETMLKHGMQAENFRFIIAYGTHPAQSDDESRKLYGPIFDNFSFHHHES